MGFHTKMIHDFRILVGDHHPRSSKWPTRQEKVMLDHERMRALSRHSPRKFQSTHFVEQSCFWLLSHGIYLTLMGFDIKPLTFSICTSFPSIIEWALPTDPQVSCDRAIRFSGFFGVRSVGPVGDFLDNLLFFQIRVMRMQPFWAPARLSQLSQRHSVSGHGHWRVAQVPSPKPAKDFSKNQERFSFKGFL